MDMRLDHQFTRNCPMSTGRPAWRNVKKLRRNCFNQTKVSYNLFRNTFQEKSELYRNESTDLLCKSSDFFLYDISFYWKVFSNWLEFVLLINNYCDLRLVLSFFTLFLAVVVLNLVKFWSFIVIYFDYITDICDI